MWKRSLMWKRVWTWKRIRPYTRRRSRQMREPARTRHNGIVFDHGPKEFPVATLLPRAPSARAAVMLGDLARWLHVRWLWLRPRSLPVLVAAAGALAAMMSWDFLAHDHGHHLLPHVDQVTVHIVK